MHLDEETIQRLVAGELSAAIATSVRKHLAACHDCRRRVTEADQEEAEVALLLRHADHPAPPIAVDAIISKASAPDFEWSRVAVAALLVAGIAGAAFAVPGSPLRAWLGAVVEQIGEGSHRAPTAPAPPPSSTPGAGIAVAPGPELVIVFTSPQPEGWVRVSLTDGADVVVSAPSGAASFSSAVDRLVIDNHGAATFDVQIPRAAARVEIRVGEDRVLLKEGARITAAGATDSTGPYLLPLAPSSR